MLNNLLQITWILVEIKTLIKQFFVNNVSCDYVLLFDASKHVIILIQNNKSYVYFSFINA